MDQLTETRWRRYGQDRVYVQAADGSELGHIDLQTETVVAAAGFAREMADCAARWLQPMDMPKPSSVADELALLSSDWHVVPTRTWSGTTDHVVIGPPGVISLTTKWHPGGRAWVSDHVLKVNGHRTNHLRTIRHEAQRTGRNISRAAGTIIEVTPAIVFVGLDAVNVHQMPTDVHITTARRLRSWLNGLPETHGHAQIDMLQSRARLSAAWH